jgi:hypothetical protein
MDAIIAIAALCQTTASGYSRHLTETHQFQLDCQQEYVECYFGKSKGDFSALSANKFLFECIKERSVKASSL